MSNENGALLNGLETDSDRIIYIPIREIQPDPNNPRNLIDEAQLRELASDMKVRGMRDPIKVRINPSGPGYFVVGGHRRYFAAFLAELIEAPCRIYKGGLSEADQLEEMLIDNEHRVDVEPVSRAIAYKKLMDLRGWNQKQLKEAFGDKIVSLLKLLDLPKEVQHHVNRGAIPVKIAGQIVRIAGEGNQIDAAVDLMAGRTTSAGIAKVVTKQSFRTPEKKLSAGTFRTFVHKDRSVTVEAPNRMNNSEIADLIKEVLHQLGESQ